MTTEADPAHPAAGAAPAASMAALDTALEYIRARTDVVPRIGVVLGTGLAQLGDAVEVADAIPYDEIPGFPLSTVETHTGRLLLGTLAGVPVVAMQGRFHRYEGHTLQQIAFPIRVLKLLGADILVLSGACGGMNPLWSPGDLVLVSDHINLLGDSPLVGPNLDELGPRFPDMSEAYDGALRRTAREVALAEAITLREGVYVAVPGPALETRAEYRMLRGLGADVVGMSTVPEVITARHCGLRVLALSIVTDQCLPDALEPAHIDDIIRTANEAQPRLTRLVRGILARLG
jgi:purine-nucleoside phosphorylase